MLGILLRMLGHEFASWSRVLVMHFLFFICYLFMYCIVAALNAVGMNRVRVIMMLEKVVIVG
jgi:uncharacterized membrane protein YagU involved in acid resistance